MNKKYKTLSIVLILAVIISVTANIVQYNLNINLANDLSETETDRQYQEKEKNRYKELARDYFHELSNLEDENISLQSRNNNLKGKAEFMNDFIEIVGDDKYYYHKFGCEYLDDSTILAFNKSAVEAMGYHKCPHCH